MRAKKDSMTWYFDIINPMLAEICRRNNVKVYITGNMVQSKGNSSYSSEKEPRMVESYQYEFNRYLPNGGSIAHWFATMAEFERIMDKKTAEVIKSLASMIDKYTYFYDIEQVSINPDTFSSFIAVEKRLWNEVYQYGFTEDEFEEYRKERRKGQIPSELHYLLCDRSEKEPLCERLDEGIGIRKTWSGRSGFWFDNVLSYSNFNVDHLRAIMREDTKVMLAPSVECTMPYIECSDALDVPINGTGFSVTALKGKEKDAVLEYIRRNDGKTTEQVSPVTSVFIFNNLSREQFVKENSAGQVCKLLQNSLLSGIVRKELGEKIYLVLAEDFWKTYQTDVEAKETTSKEDCFDENGNLCMTISEAESVWSVKTVKSGYAVSGYTGTDEVLYVPAYIDGKPVVAINKGKKNTTVKKVIIPETVKTINTGAFSSYTQLAEFEINGDDVQIYAAAFSKCPLLYDSNGCVVINGQLIDCRRDGDVTVPGTVKRIPAVFAHDIGLQGAKIKKLIIESGVEEVGESAFRKCNSIESIEIANTVTKIEMYAFSECTNLVDVSIPNSVKNIGYSAFRDCPSLETICCEAPSEPAGWHDSWNYDNHPVVWGYKK